MVKKSLLLIFVLFTCALVTIAGAAAVDFSVVWNKTYGEPGANDSAYSIVQVPGGGYLFVGDTRSFGAGETDSWVVNLSGSGDEQWNRTYGDPNEDVSRSVINTSDGNFVFAGTFTYATEENRKDTDVRIVKFDPSGDIIWDKTFGGPDDNASAFAVAETPDGGYVVAGTTALWGEPDTDALVIKLNSSGIEEWTDTFGEPGLNDSAYSVVAAPSGEIGVAGSTESFESFGTDALILKIDSSGNETWNVTFGGAENDAARSIVLAPDGAFVFAGSYMSRAASGGAEDDALVVKLKSNGEIVWNWTYGESTANESAYDIIATLDGGYLFAGRNGTSPLDNDACVVKIDGKGAVEGELEIGGANPGDRAASVIQAAASEYVFAGTFNDTKKGGQPDTDAWVVKLATTRKTGVQPSPKPPKTPKLCPVQCPSPTPKPTPKPASKTGCIGDFVWNDTNGNGIQDAGEEGIKDVNVQLLGSDGKTVVKQTKTDSRGTYLFSGLQPGDYYVNFSLPTGYTFTKTDAGGNDKKDSDANVKTGQTAKITLKTGEKQCQWDAGLIKQAPSTKGEIGDLVWDDTDRNGVQDQGEPGVAGVTVRLLDGTGNPVQDAAGNPREAKTDANGSYLFTDLSAGSYIVEFVAPKDLTFTLPDVTGTDDAHDSDAADVTGGSMGTQVTGRTGVITLAAGEQQLQWDAGLRASGTWYGSGIGDLVWDDSNQNGIQDQGEPGVAGVTVRLLYGNGNPVNDNAGNALETKTDANGNYHFKDLANDDYIVEFVAPQGATFTAQDAGDDTKDSDADPGTGRTGVITLLRNELQDQWDAGLVTGSAPGATAEVHGKVWEDVNGDNIQQREQGNQEPGIPNVEVKLRKTDNVGTIQDRTTTNADGLYQFTNVPPGNYYLEFTLLSGYKFVGTPDQGNDNEDSDVDPLTGTTESFTLQAGEIKDHWDAGMTHFTGEIGGTAWEDDGDGLLEDATGGDHGVVAGVAVALMRYEGGGQYTKIETDATDASGAFLFSGLPPGSYGLVIKPPAWATFTKFDQYGAGRNNVGLTLQNNGYGFIAPPITLGVGESQKQWDVGFLRKSGTVKGTTDWGEVSKELAHTFYCPPPLSWMGICLVAPILSPHDVSGPVGMIAGTGMDGGGFVDAAIDVYVNSILRSWVPGMLQAAAGLPESTTADENVQANSEALLTQSELPSASTRSTPQTVSSPEDADFPDVVNESETQPVSGTNGTDMGVVLGGVVNDANRNNELDADEAGVPGVEVQLLAGPDTTTQEDTETNQAAANVTDANGTYIFTDLTPGEYYLQFVLPPGYEFTSPAEGSDLDPQTGRTTAVVISSEEALAVINVGIAESSNLSSNSTIGDFVWNDTNGDGIQDDGEGGIADAAVELYYANETLANSTTTDADGIYTFGNLSAGEYYLVFTPPEGYNLTTANQGTDDALDSDADPLTGTTEIVTLAENETQLDWDAGANVTAAGGAEENATIGDFVWNDTNGDGLQSEGEPGVPGVTVRLLDENGDPVTDVTGAAVETVTGEDGHYALQGVVGTTYIVEVVPPDGLTFVTPDAGDDTLDSDVLVETGRTEPFTLAGEDLTRDAGLNATVTEVEAAVVGGYAWSDTDANGVRDASEIGMPGVVVTLLGADGTDAGMTTTDDAGAYRFIGVAAGTYSLSFSPPEGYTFSPAGQDSTADPASGTTEQFELGPGEEQTDWNVGLVPPIAEETQTPEEEVTPEEEMTSEEEVTPEEETAGGSIL